MRGVTYTRNDLEDREVRHTGVIAQEVEQVLPEAVREGINGKTVAYGNMVGLLIEAIKEQQKQIDELKANAKYKASLMSQMPLSRLTGRRRGLMITE